MIFCRAVVFHKNATSFVVCELFLGFKGETIEVFDFLNKFVQITSGYLVFDEQIGKHLWIIELEQLLMTCQWRLARIH